MNGQIKLGQATIILYNWVIFFLDCEAYLSSQTVEINVTPIIRGEVNQSKLSPLSNKLLDIPPLSGHCPNKGGKFLKKLFCCISGRV